MFTLEKLKVEDGKYSAVRSGSRQSSDTVMIFLAGEHEPRVIKGIAQIKVGWQVLLRRGFNSLNTSPVEEILEYNPEESYIRFRTQTSVYELRRTDEEVP